ncbi:MAG TPA: NlpC/P60 family protein [Actinomycetota bacterium]|nr:NlpC/P60 family protein [Actinomycetota bacterium]
MRSRRAGFILAASIPFLLPVTAVQAVPSRSGHQAEIERLSVQISQLDEDYNEARINLGKAQRQVQEARRAKQTADERLLALRKTASSRAAAAYRVGIPNILLILFGSESVSDFSKKMGIAARVGDWESGVMSSLHIAKQRSDERTLQLQKELARAKAISDSISEKRTSLRSRVAEQRGLLSRLTAAEAAQRRRAVEVRTIKPLLGPIVSLPGSGGAKTAVQTAYGLIGRPYRWGASGPGSFDCSGFTAYVWRAAGVSLPHSSRAQYAATKRVSREDLQPGDLVFFGRPIHHVGMYVGGGNMINSPQTGETVAVRSMARRDYVGAGRPGV